MYLWCVRVCMCVYLRISSSSKYTTEENETRKIRDTKQLRPYTYNTEFGSYTGTYMPEIRFNTKHIAMVSA